MSILLPVKNNVLITDELPDGEYVGVLFRLVQLGTQPDTFNGQTRPVRKILLSWVIPSVHRLINEEYRSVIVHKKYTESLWETAHLRRDITAMLGRDIFNEMSESEGSYELENLLGLTCMLTTQQKAFGPQNRSFAEITRFDALPDDEIIPEIDMSIQSLAFANFDWNLFSSFSERLRESIAASPEFNAMPQDIRQQELSRIENRHRTSTESGQEGQALGMDSRQPQETQTDASLSV